MSTLINLAGSGLATGIIGIPNGSGWYTFYADFTAAMAAAVSGDTIVFFDDITETGAAVLLKDGVNVNLNGYTFTNASTTLTNAAIGMSTFNCTVRIYNGRIVRTSATPATARTENVCFLLTNNGSKIYLEGVEIDSNEGLGCYNPTGSNNSIIGGTIDGNYLDDAESNVFLQWVNVINTRFPNIYGNSLVTTNTTSLFTNCIFGENQGATAVSSQGGTFNNCSFWADSAMYNSTNIVNVNNCSVKANTAAFDGSNYRISNTSVTGGSFGYLEGNNTLLNCTLHAAIEPTYILGDVILLHNCDIFSGTSCIEIQSGAHDGIEITGCTLTSIGGANTPVIDVSPTWTGTGLKVQKCYGDVANNTNYFISSTAAKDAYLVDNTANNVAALTNNINNLQTNTTDNYGNIITN